MKHYLFQARENALVDHDKVIRYINKEIDIIENLGYVESQRFFEQFPERAKDVILGVDRNKDKNYYSKIDDSSQDIKEGMLVRRVLYLSKVVTSLKNLSKSSRYHPAEGSFWESIGETLGKLASDVEKEGLF